MSNGLDLGLLRGVEGEKLRNILKTSAAGLFREVSGGELLRQMREQNIRIRDSDFYTLRREVLGLNKNEERIRNLRPDTSVPETYVNRDHSFDIQSDYLYRFRARYFDEEKSEMVSTYASYITDKRLSPEEALQELRQQLEISPEENESISLGFEILSLSYVLGRNLSLAS